MIIPSAIFPSVDCGFIVTSPRYSPDSLAFYIKRTHAHEKPANGSFNESERATVVFYSWTGSSVSKVTTGMSNAPEVIDMVDREKDILGKITEGVTGDAKLVASNEYYIGRC